MSKVTRPALRYHGAKFRLSSWIQSFFPPHTCYVEPFGGAAGVLLQKPRCYAEVYNDLDGDVVNLFRVLRDPIARSQLVDAVRLTPYAREEFVEAWTPSEDPIERARRLCIRAQMGFGSAGATKGMTGFRIDTKRAYGTAQHDWTAYPDAIEAAGERLRGVLIENRPAIEVMVQHDGPETLHFVDPPYVFETRVPRIKNGKIQAYRHEMDDAAHVELLSILTSLRGMVVLSGYYTDLYHARLPGWTLHQTKARISAGRGTKVKTECVWINPAAANALNEAAHQPLLLGIE
ncbi:DNA adenine methylase [uncultured Herbaspirillum sp.]|uniref:DNA adenine methylase n=1 Tax=uncultured Herbaspirillum sp. TaxID=160236 RepID=UPI002607058E|nr:DNA adenine methylase [uncultured Herbaspirillum sp.]